MIKSIKNYKTTEKTQTDAEHAEKIQNMQKRYKTCKLGPRDCKMHTLRVGGGHPSRLSYRMHRVREVGTTYHNTDEMYSRRQCLIRSANCGSSHLQSSSLRAYGIGAGSCRTLAREIRSTGRLCHA